MEIALLWGFLKIFHIFFDGFPNLLIYVLYGDVVDVDGHCGGGAFGNPAYNFGDGGTKTGIGEEEVGGQN